MAVVVEVMVVVVVVVVVVAVVLVMLMVAVLVVVEVVVICMLVLEEVVRLEVVVYVLTQCTQTHHRHTRHPPNHMRCPSVGKTCASHHLDPKMRPSHPHNTLNHTFAHKCVHTDPCMHDIPTQVRTHQHTHNK